MGGIDRRVGTGESDTLLIHVSLFVSTWFKECEPCAPVPFDSIGPAAREFVQRPIPGKLIHKCPARWPFYVPDFLSLPPGRLETGRNRRARSMEFVSANSTAGFPAVCVYPLR